MFVSSMLIYCVNFTENDLQVKTSDYVNYELIIWYF